MSPEVLVNLTLEDSFVTGADWIETRLARWRPGPGGWPSGVSVFRISVPWTTQRASASDSTSLFVPYKVFASLREKRRLRLSGTTNSGNPKSYPLPRPPPPPHPPETLVTRPEFQLVSALLTAPQLCILELTKRKFKRHPYEIPQLLGHGSSKFFLQTHKQVLVQEKTN